MYMCIGRPLDVYYQIHAHLSAGGTWPERGSLVVHTFVVHTARHTNPFGSACDGRCRCICACACTAVCIYICVCMFIYTCTCPITGHIYMCTGARPLAWAVPVGSTPADRLEQMQLTVMELLAQVVSICMCMYG